MKRQGRNYLGVGLVAALWLPMQLFAHALKTESEPADGAVVQGSPPVIAMSFDSPMRITSLVLRDADGEPIELARDDAMRPVTRVEARPPALAAGQYVVEWRGLAPDGHAMRDTFTFTVE
ncbi:copper resistance protein CopC [Ectothiorhodospiraceae bacterium 2226]|nr:copper resistance protein CopC [Ectothiorhodospiraceae bacterium 2226]